jgi:RNA polymerase sigma-70 factor (sigma-E family)
MEGRIGGRSEVRQRDKGEFVAFAEACRPALRRTAYLMCGDWERAADITQEALIRVYLAWPRLDRDRGLRSYARRAVVSVAIEQARKMSSREIPTEELGGGSTADPAGQVVDRVLLMSALAELPPRQRACVVLRFYDDLGVEAVADALGCRPGTVKSQTARGLEALRAAYARRGGELWVRDDARTDAKEATP